MPYKDTLAEVDFNLQRDSAFSYQCNVCSRCCHNKAIRVGAYEILRLARRLGITTTEFIERHTEAGGTVLRMQDENNRGCIFLNQQGCGVHSDRPLACRLYPLARWVDADGTESFGHLTPHPKTEGIYGTSATVADYLD
jgi:Fe-S-cluster containining protein